MKKKTSTLSRIALLRALCARRRAEAHTETRRAKPRRARRACACAFARPGEKERASEPSTPTVPRLRRKFVQDARVHAHLRARRAPRARPRRRVRMRGARRAREGAGHIRVRTWGSHRFLSIEKHLGPSRNARSHHLAQPRRQFSEKSCSKHLAFCVQNDDFVAFFFLPTKGITHDRLQKNRRHRGSAV